MTDNALFSNKREMIEMPYDNQARLLAAAVYEIQLLLGSYLGSQIDADPSVRIAAYSNDEVVDIVTAYIPQKPWWETPSRRGR